MSSIKDFFNRYPRWVAWAVLSIGMVVILIWSAWDYVLATPEEGGFSLGQVVALIVATVLVAGLCVWIIGWEDEDQEPGTGTLSQEASSGQSADTVVSAGAEETS